ncbi:hypothetical protein PR202_ga04140 [Eleusine coracana subsp. coracana]|uniref:Uncharacterized protein n=1 Tax=Eleusine coracana subsp. coracana TaxID=191504 RepID=A0AAV5BR88_ELECO|nr:hypothetical protein PR202_ga04140 [Eleusine coracana subsp. coracana]
MASAAFKSTTRRSLHGASSSSDRSDQRPCPRRSRSRFHSVSAAPRGRGVEGDYANTCTNPLFDSTAATSSGGGDAARRERDRGREPAAAGERGRCPSLRRGAAPAVLPLSAGGGLHGRGRTSKSIQTVHLKGQQLKLHAEKWMKLPNQYLALLFLHLDAILSMPSYRKPFSRHSGSSSGNSPEFDPDSAEFIFDISDYATEYRAAETSLDSDTDAVEGALGVRHNAADQGWEPIEIPLEFDPDAAELVSDMKHHDANQQWQQMGIPLEFDPDSSEPAPDITEYTIKLKQSHECARKLRADLAVEEQREQELSRMLKDIVTDPSFSETHRKRTRRKSSIERLKVSRHLAEEAMNYFEECVSISTMDSTDFSSPDDPQPNSILSVPPKNNSRFFHKGRSNFQESHTTAGQHNHLEVSKLISFVLRNFLFKWNLLDSFNVTFVGNASYYGPDSIEFIRDSIGFISSQESDDQTQCSISIIGSDISDNVALSHINAPGLKIRNNSSDDIDRFDTPRSRSSCFSFTHRLENSAENCGVQQYRGNFGRGSNKDRKEMKSSYSADDYTFQKANLDLLTDMLTFQSRIEHGGLLICNTRTL